MAFILQGIFISVVLFEVFTVVTIKNAVFWDVTPCDSYNNRRFKGNHYLLHVGDKNWQARNNVSSN
jgi:hypothetical protein